MSTLPALPPYFVEVVKAEGETFTADELAAIAAVDNVDSIDTVTTPNMAIVSIADVDAANNAAILSEDVKVAARTIATLFPGTPVRWVTISTSPP